MKRAGNLFDHIMDFDNLQKAFHKAQKGKADRSEVVSFRENLHARIEHIRFRLLAGSFVFGSYRQFYICDPKTRLIQAAPFEQRVVHHAMINILGPVFERRFISDSYACRKGKGQHAALKQAARFIRGQPFCLKMDVRKFYDSMDHAVLSGILARQIKDRRVLELLDCVIGSYCTAPGKGLPIGNLTSQFLGNVVLDQFDHWMKEEQRCRYYLRYMDDMLCFGSHEQMVKLRNRSVYWLGENLRLEINHCGEINRTAKGIPFLGRIMNPDGIRLNQRSEHRLRSMFRRLEQQAERGLLSMSELPTRCGSLFAASDFGNTKSLRRYLSQSSRFRDA